VVRAPVLFSLEHHSLLLTIWKGLGFIHWSHLPGAREIVHKDAVRSHSHHRVEYLLRPPSEDWKKLLWGWEGLLKLIAKWLWGHRWTGRSLSQSKGGNVNNTDNSSITHWGTKLALLGTSYASIFILLLHLQGNSMKEATL
jgi:hypothetical protein